MLTVRLYNFEEDYVEIKNWAVKLRLVIPHPDCLPGVGAVVVDEDGKKYGAGFLYLNNETPVSVLEWIFVNPDINAREKVETYKHIIGSLFI